MLTRSLVAFNTATASENKIHDDAVAKRFGFSGGLVPGVDVYAYLTWGPVAAWGRAWLAEGEIEARFALPTYDGETVTATFAEEPSGEEARVELHNRGGVVVASGAARRRGSAPPADPSRFPHRELPASRPPAGPDVLTSGTVLGSWDARWEAATAPEYLADVREELPLYAEEGIAHPGWVLRLANYILAGNVVLGPWIHVGSRVTNHGVVTDGAAVSCRGSVAREYEHKGHRFVELDLGVTSDEQLVASIWHTAIYLPRQVREAG